ncbi:hypothetical protein Cme02nite_07310 [Catellatospora methionotrophica]|uniref:Uncharacterized protein n=1 Tax=Catellatospora methionotrophica TaxID=121620 RepID=A0A8J3LB23_9ACTN|nr:hypothetical protein [Catellatospora methionotrophica]GIG12399.1 hypothetical protein Cme02nite_07310 [Catellatospora methionotrophica]
MGTPAPAICPQTWDDLTPSATSRRGTLVPGGAAEALLCSYPPVGNPPLALGVSRRITDRANEVGAYLNGLAAEAQPDTVCSASQSTAHIIVFGYQDRAPVILHARNCAWDRQGITRYGADLRKITAYWGAAWNE